MVLDAGVGRVRLIADPTGLSASIGTGVAGAVKGALPTLKGAATQLTKALTSPLALAAVGAGIVKLGLDFETSFQRIGAISNATTADIAKWRDEVLSLSGETAQAPKELADALFFLSSAGLESSQVMEALDAAAKGSAVGLGDTADVANIVASALNAYAKSGLTAASVTDTLVAAVREGRAEPEEFANALGRILPIAAEAGVSFDQVAASMAGLSNIGLDVNEGTTAMRGALQAIVAPGAQAAKAMKDIGLSAQDLLDSIQQDGLIGALTLLKERALENADGQADYLNILRKVIPNIRSLTGVLGLSGDALSKNEEIFKRVANAAGDLNEAFKSTEQSPAFQFRKALNDLIVIGTEIGVEVLPVLVTVLKSLAPIFRGVAAAAQPFVDVLKQAAEAVDALTQGHLPELGAHLDLLNTSLGLIQSPFAGVIDLFSGFTEHVDLSQEAIDRMEQEVLHGTLSVEDFASRLEAAGISTEGLGDALAAALVPMNMADDGIAGLSDHLIGLPSAGEEAAAAIHRFAGLTKKGMAEFRKAVIDSVQVTIGQFAKLADAFKTTPAELAKQAALAVQIARRQQRDLQSIFSDKSLSETAKKALASLPADQRHAFADAGKEIRAQIAKDAVALKNLNDRSFREITRGTQAVAKEGGKGVGLSLTSGMFIGIIEGSPAVKDAAAEAVREAIAAARAAAQAGSPSKLMAKLGRDLLDGLSQGIESRTGRLTDQLQGLVKLIRENVGVGAADQAQAFGRDLDELGRKFTRLGDKIRTFRDAIKEAFASFDLTDTLSGALEEFSRAQEQFLADQATFEQGDRTGAFPTAPVAPDLSALIRDQVAQAKELGRILRELQKKGLSTTNLQDLASQGVNAVPLGQALLDNPELIEQMNDAQQDIADVLQRTGDILTKQAFGEKVERLGGQFDRLIDNLQRFISNLQLPELRDETRDFINQVHRLNDALHELGGGAGGGGNGAGAPGLRSSGGDTLNFNFPAAIGTRDEIIDWVDAGLKKKQRRNSG